MHGESSTHQVVRLHVGENIALPPSFAGPVHVERSIQLAKMRVRDRHFVLGEHVAYPNGTRNEPVRYLRIECRAIDNHAGSASGELAGE
ncbi:hypothetical protein [Caballeronia novacaledonica]|uniref:hypothetical protein n=1 Tax=Caballeronia novacaledonica TaxID=1544861 RepID=UPI0015E707B1|nr:hypothetical protein [Caballeronia novacaledonica]